MGPAAAALRGGFEGRLTAPRRGVYEAETGGQYGGGMWTCPPAPDGFEWRLLYGQAGQGLASLHLLPQGQEVAKLVLVHWRWAVMINAHQQRRGGLVWHPVPSRERGMVWLARWATANWARLTRELVRPDRLSGPFLLEPLPPRGRLSGRSRGL